MAQFDLIIHGGGMVGATTALRLADAGLNVLLVERYPQPLFDSQSAMALRVSAINLASEALLRTVGVWEAITQLRVCPYRYLGVWEDPAHPVTFDAKEIGQPHLGHIIENAAIQHALWQACLEHSQVECLGEQSITAIEQTEHTVQITLDSGEHHHARLLVGADGANSVIRELVGIGLTGWEYAQHALVVGIRTEAAQQDMTWQQFYPSGPRAFLPLYGQHGSLVWYDSADRVRELQALPTSQLAQQIEAHFPERLGGFEIEGVTHFPLTRRHANHYVQGRVVLLGDAAHTINPLAGQGVNLGFKDVDALCNAICRANEQGHAWDEPDVLRRFLWQRRPHNSVMISAMDSLYALFSNEQPAISHARKAGLALAAKVAPARIAATRYACGLF